MTAPPVTMVVFGGPSLFFGRLDRSHFLLLVFVFGAVAYATSAAGNFVIFLICGLVQAYRGARLETRRGDLASARMMHAALICGCIGAPWLLSLRDPDLAEGPAQLVAVLMGLLLLLVLRGGLLIRVLDWAERDLNKKPVPSIEELQAQQEKLHAAPKQLRELATFDASDPDLLDAWQREDTARIETLLRSGDTINRQTWATAGTLLNDCLEARDGARQRLTITMKEAEPVLRRFGLADAAEATAFGKKLAGDAKVLTIDAPWSQRVNYAGGAGQAIGRAAAGSGSWQGAILATIFAGVMLAINHQKRLRQLKEIEGQVTAMATAIRGDIQMFIGMTEEEVVPQYDQALVLIDRLARLTTQLRDAETVPTDKKQGYELFLAAGEARKLIAE